jgi:hypothetical protein
MPKDGFTNDLHLLLDIFTFTKILVLEDSTSIMEMPLTEDSDHPITRTHPVPLTEKFYKL